MKKIVIIGNSAAGSAAVATLVKHPVDAEITIISRDNYLSYRKNLFIDYLAGRIKEKDLFLCDNDFYGGEGVSFYKGNEVIKVDVKRKNVLLKDRNKIDYDYLIVASGSKVSIPDVPGRNKDGVVALNSLEDLKQVKKSLFLTDTVCVFGGTPLGVNMVRVIASMGKDVKIACEGHKTEEGFPEFSQNGEKIEVIGQVSPEEFIGEGTLQAVKFSNGKIIGTSLVIFAGQYIPASAFLKESVIPREDEYICINEDMCAGMDNVFACGSVAWDKTKDRRAKSWEEAVLEGKRAAEQIIKIIA